MRIGEGTTDFPCIWIWSCRRNLASCVAVDSAIMSLPQELREVVTRSLLGQLIAPWAERNTKPAPRHDYQYVSVLCGCSSPAILVCWLSLWHGCLAPQLPTIRQASSSIHQDDLYLKRMHVPNMPSKWMKRPIARRANASHKLYKSECNANYVNNMNNMNIVWQNHNKIVRVWCAPMPYVHSN